jgi:hypothetical protein
VFERLLVGAVVVELVFDVEDVLVFDLPVEVDVPEL